MLGLLLIANAGWILYLCTEWLSIAIYSGRIPGSLNMAEATYLSALWSGLVAKVYFWIFVNLVVLGWILVSARFEDQNSSEATLGLGIDPCLALSVKAPDVGRSESTVPTHLACRRVERWLADPALPPDVRTRRASSNAASGSRRE
jgi:hypothetical protein